jgi:MFS transporter, FSR family, fosmidomycin resistance protein
MHAHVHPSDSVDRSWSVIGIVSFAHGTSHFFHMLIPALFPWIQAEFALSFTALGALTAVFYCVSGIGQAAAGFFVDRFGAVRTLWAGLACFAVAGPILALANSYAGLVLAAVVAGLGNCVFHPADFALLNQRVQERRLGHAFSAHGVAGNLGWAVAPVFMLALAPAMGWRGAAAATCLVAVAAIGILWWQRSALGVVKGRPPAAEPQTGSAVATRTILTQPAVWLSFAFFLTSVAAFGALQNFAPAVLQTLHGLNLATAQLALTTYLVVAAVGLVIGGFLTSYGHAPERLISIVMVLSAMVAAFLALGIGGAEVVLLGMACIGLAAGIAGPSRDLLVRRSTLATLSKDAYGRVYGIVYSGLDTGLALSPLFFGWLLDRGQPAAVLLAVGCLQLLAVVAAVSVVRVTRKTP